MRRNPDSTSDMPGQDSFLDVVANMVGILIILVMVVGVRASQAPVEPPKAETPTAEEDGLQAIAHQATSLELDVHELDMQSKRIQAQIEQRRHEREELATVVAGIEEEVAKQREQLGAAGTRDYQLRTNLTAAHRKAEELAQQRQSLAAARPENVTIQNLPTPLSKTVHGKEVHFQLRGGRVVYIPLDELVDQFQGEARQKLWKLDGRAQMSDVVGPEGGFRLRYRLGRFEIPAEVQRETGQVGSVVRLVRWELIPVSTQLGEPVEIAISQGSQFRYLLSTLNPPATAITIWTYPDSFAAFAKIKRELHSLGFATASRPLPDGQLIAGSPDGTRSSAQ